MPASFLSRHRTICAVLADIRDIAVRDNNSEIVALCDEAIPYAKSMSAKLVEYKDVFTSIHQRHPEDSR